MDKAEASVGRTRSSGLIETHGAMGCVDGDGADHFNFPQSVWLYPNVPMRATPRYSRAAEVLAVNILSLVLEERDFRAAQGRTSARAVRLAQAFYDECLAELPTGGWCIPLETIHAWVRTALRPHRSMPRAHQRWNGSALASDSMPPSMRR
jgi:hypothetical protein